MHCSKCGTEVSQGTSFCPHCGAQVAFYSGQQINTWLVPAILGTLFCCMPFGIVSIVFASKANSALGAGDFQQARENAEKAKIWFWVSFGVGIVASIAGIFLQILAATVAD